jgi:quercetin dioxygenase-like cupin family protein
LDLKELERRHVVRFDALKPSEGAPPDARLERFRRERFMVLGRKSERRPGESGPDIDAGINLAYVRCEPGKGFCAHKHPGWEMFVPMSGRWRISVEGQADVVIEAWDAMVVPGELFHGAENVGEESAVMMSINPGSDTARFAIAPDVLAEIQAAKAAAGV